MASWSTIRQATSDDSERMEDAARRFAQRHDIEGVADAPHMNGQAMSQALEWDLEYRAANDFSGEGRYLRSLWRRAIKRALREPSAEGIAYGYVGYNVT